MTRKSMIALIAACGVLILGITLAPPRSARAEPSIFASPVHAGCYLTKIDRCKIHVEPFTINLTTGTKLARFQLVAWREGPAGPAILYDFRPDLSNPAPSSGSTYTPSLVAKDYAATCGASYSISLQGSDTGNSNVLNLGTTAQFTCPNGTFLVELPIIQNN